MSPPSIPSSEALADRLRNGAVLIGSFVQIGHPAVCEILAGFARDFVVLDQEHGNMPSNLSPLLAACDAVHLPALVRVPTAGAPWPFLALDAGAAGLLVPRVDNADTARGICAMAKYPPV